MMDDADVTCVDPGDFISLIDKKTRFILYQTQAECNLSTIIHNIKESLIAGNHSLNPPSTWVDKYGDYLYSFALYRIQDDSLAQDLVQDTLAAALEARERFKGTSSEKTWLTGILKHKIIDSIRKRYREPVFEDKMMETQEMHDSFDDRGRWKTGPEKWASNPEHLLEQKVFLNIVKKCLQDLPKRPARALSLRELEGETTQTICKVLNITATNCWVILHRARFLMRKCIELNWL